MPDVGRADHEGILGEVILPFAECDLALPLAVIHDLVTGMRMFRPAVVLVIVVIDTEQQVGGDHLVTPPRTKSSVTFVSRIVNIKQIISRFRSFCKPVFSCRHFHCAGRSTAEQCFLHVPVLRPCDACPRPEIQL